MILRKLGPQTDAARCASGRACPDIFLLKTGDFAVIGTDITTVGCEEFRRNVGLLVFVRPPASSSQPSSLHLVSLRRFVVGHLGDEAVGSTSATTAISGALYDVKAGK